MTLKEKILDYGTEENQGVRNIMVLLIKAFTKEGFKGMRD